MKMICERFLGALERLQHSGLLRRRLVVDGPQGPRITLDGKSCLAFCSNDYLGLANDPRIAQAAVRALERYGVGAGASHLVTGHTAAHESLEAALARFVRLPRALLFGTGYLANIGVITALTTAEDVIFSDALNHASLIDGARLSRARVVKLPHCDPDALEKALAANRGTGERFVVTESVFSMDGDIAPLDRMLELCERFDAWLAVDDAHGFGVLGEQGRGALEHFGLQSPRIVYMGTLGKAAGVAGAFVAGEEAVVETLLQRARSYIYTTASPAFLAAAAEESLRIVAEERWRRDRLKELITRLKSNLKSLKGSQTPIQPLVLGSNERALEASRALRERGIVVTAIRPPTVPEGTARLRISLSAAHEARDVEQLASALGEILEAHRAWRSDTSSPAPTPA